MVDYRYGSRSDEAKLHMKLINLQDGEAQIVSDLVAAGARLDVYGDKDGMVPLHHAAQNGQAKVVAAMIAAGARLESRGGLSVTPLQLAAVYGKVEVCRVLLEAGANPRALDKKKRTPMVAAAQNGYGEVVQHFLGSAKVKPSRQELAEVLKALAAHCRPEYVQEVLDRLGGEPELVNVAFYEALRGGNVEVAKRLVQQGADWRNPPGGRSLLQLAKRDAQDLKRYLRSLTTGDALEAAMDEQPSPPPTGAGRDSFGVL